MIDLFLVAVIFLSGVLLLWPYAFYPLVLRLLPTKRLALREDASAPSLSLLFCAYNEAAALPAKLENLRALKAAHPDLQILAYDDGSDDGSGDLLAGAEDVLTLVRGAGRTGKAHGMKALAARASGDILIFTDANVLLAEDAVAHLLPYYSDPEVGGVLGSLRYEGTKSSSSAGVGGLYWRIEEALKNAESRTGNVMGADGSIFSVRRALYPDFPDDVLDDLTVSMAGVFAGKRLVKARDVIAHETMVAQRGEEFRRKRRIGARSWRTQRHLRPQLRAMSGLDRFKYASRKLVRWFGALWMATGGMAALALAWRCSPFAAIAMLAGALLLLLLGFQMKRGPFAALVDLVLAYVATLRGILLAMQGKSFTTWAPAKSRDGGRE